LTIEEFEAKANKFVEKRNSSTMSNKATATKSKVDELKEFEDKANRFIEKRNAIATQSNIPTTTKTITPVQSQKETIADKMDQLWVEDTPSTPSVNVNKNVPALRQTLAQRLATGITEKPTTPTVNLPTMLTKYANIYNSVKNQPKTKTPTSSDNPYKATSVKDFVNQVQSGTLPKTTPTLLPTNAQMDAATLERNEKLNKANFGYANELERLNQERDNVKKQLKASKDDVNLQNKLADIETNIKKEQLKYNYDNAKYDTSFFGKFGANYSVGKLNEEANKAWSNYLNNKTQANREYAEALSNQINKFSEDNSKALKSNGFVSKSAANYLPQLTNQTGAGLKGAAVGGLAAGGAAAGTAFALGQLGPQVAVPEELATVPGAFVWGATKGGKAGYVAGVGKYSYDNMQGAAFKNLIDLGVDEETATKAAKDEAVISSMIEMADAGIDVATLGLGKLVDLIGKSGLKLLAKEGAKETAENAGKKLLKELGKYGVVKYGANILQEGAEEASQELVSIANENRLKNGNANTGKLNLIGNTVKQAFNLTDEEKKRVTESAKEGSKVAGMFGGVTALTTSRVNNSLINNLRNDISKINAQSSTETIQNNTSKDLIPGIIKAPQNANMNVTEQNTARQQIENTINNNTHLAADEKQGLLQILEENSSNLNPDAINFFNDTINNLQNNHLEQVNNTEDKKVTYKKYLNDKTELDKTALNTAKDSVPANRSGRRTKEQWLKVANTIGQQIYDLSPEEIERYAYRSWQETHPNQANNLNRQGKGFVKFTSDEWIDTITKSAQEAKAQTQANNKLPTQAEQVSKLPKSKNNTSTVGTDNLKQKQLDIIQKSNPMRDDYHTGIRTIDDIKTFKDTIDDDESFVWGDFSREDALKALEKGEVKVYSSRPVENGNFVSTSYNQAKEYAGNGKIYSKMVPLTDVAWINGDEGQYARVDNSLLQKNIENKQTMKYNKDIENMFANVKVGEILNVPTKSLLPLLNGGGYRTEEQISNLRNIMLKEGVPGNIKVYRGDNGQIELEDGNHRIQLADELGIKNMPVEMVERWSNVLPEENDNLDIQDEIKEVIYNDGASNQNSNTNEESRSESRSLPESNVMVENRGTTNRNAKIPGKKSYDNESRSNVKNEGNNRQIEDSNKSSFSLPSTDSQGRTLSKQQQEYFKDSKVRDQDGKLLVMYHGTSEDFNTFASNKIDVANLGKGFYFTDKKEIADSYAERRTQERGGNRRVIEAYIKSIKPFDYGNVTREQAVSYLNFDFYDPENIFMSKIRDVSQAQNQAENFVKEFEGEQQENWGEKRVTHAEERKFIKHDNKYDYSMLINTANDSFQRWLKKEGYDSILIPGKDKKTGIAGMVAVVFNSNQIKNVDNTAPTANEDIRKFKSSESPRPYMNLNEKISMNNDSKHNKVGLAQIEETINEIVPVRHGKFRQKAYGIYKGRGEIIRIKQKNDIPTALHELTHHLDKQLDLSKTGNFDSELIPIAVVENNASLDTKRAEGVAEFGRYYMTDPEFAQEIAPKYFEAFEEKLNQNPEMKAKVDQLQNMVSDYLRKSPLNRVLSHIDYGDDTANIFTRAKERALEFKKSFRKNFIDDLDPLKKVINDITGGKKLPVDEDAYARLRLNRGVTGKVQVALEHGIVNNQGNKVGKSLKEVIAPVSDNIDEFVAYISALRAKDLDLRNIESGFNQKDVDEILNLYGDNEKFNKAAEELYEFEDAILHKTLVASGIITEEQAKAYKKANPHYVPFYRVMDENFKQSKDGLSKTPKRIKGSTRDIINPLESIIKNTYSYYMMAEKNNAYKSLFNLANQYDGTGKWFDKVPTDMTGVKISANDIKGILDQLDLDKTDIDYNELFTTIFKPANHQKGNIITVMEKGKPVHYEIMDEDLYKILGQSNSGIDTWWSKILGSGSSALRVGATHTLEFVARNPIKDTFDAFTYSKNKFIPVVDTVIGIFNVAGKSDLYYKWLESGGSGSSYTNAQRTTLRNTLNGLLPEINKQSKLDVLGNIVKHPLKTYLDLIGEISNITEEGTRVGEFRRALKNNKNLRQAALESRDITVDFSRGGKQIKEANKYIAFLNANVQGLDKMITAFKERPVATTIKCVSAFMLPSMLIAALQDDDDRDKVPQWEKDSHWIFFVNGVPIRIPKPQGIGRTFANLGESILDYMRKKDPEVYQHFLIETLGSYSPANDISSVFPNTLQPPFEVATNYSFFRKTNIVPRSMENRSPEYQYDENTSTIAKQIGKKFKVSPKQVDYLISGYFGNLGKDVTNLLGLPADAYEKFTNGTTKNKTYATTNSILKKIPLVKGFIASDYASPQLDKFYNNKSKALTNYEDAKFKYSGSNITETQKKELEELKKINSLYNKTYNEIKDLQDEINEVTANPNRGNEYKKLKIKELNNEIKKKASSIEELIPGYKRK